MNADDDDRLIDIAGAVADGDPVDWEAPARNASDSGALERLRLLEAVAAAYRAAREAAPDEQHPTPDGAAGPTRPLVLFTWGHLQVLEKLGEGSFGEVYRAFDPVLERDVALKLRRAESPGGVVGRRAILDEARRLARVRHPNVLEVHGADVHDGRVGLWADLISGQTLEERLRQDGPLGSREAALAGIEVCDALAAVHAQGLVHGDVKAANIMRERGGRLVLMDFGAVTEVSRCGGGGAATLGTPLVLAPEVLRGEIPGPTADLFSLGVLIYRLVSGRYPVEADSVEELCGKHERGEMVPLADRRPDLPAAYLEVVERALGPTPKDRFPSAGVMRSALARSLGQLPHEAAEAGAIDVPASAADGQSRSRRSRIFPALAFGLLLTVAVVMFAQHRAARQPTAVSPSAVQGLAVEAAVFREVSGRGEPVATRSRVTPGDRLFLELESAEPIHVYVLNEDDRGNRYVLFPVAGLDSTNPLPAGVRHRLPGRRAGVAQAWEVSSAGGREAFLVVAARQALPELEQELTSFDASDPARRPEVREAATGAAGMRGIGGLAPSSARPVGGDRFIDRLAERLEARQRTDGSVWVEKLELSNPGG